MEKKKYIRPESEYVSFYSDKDEMSSLNINDYAYQQDSSSDGSVNLSGVNGSIGGGSTIPDDFD